ncbi:MAG: sugar ABC transporter permease [Firmicutes bacterium]|nr:sugar ABC transporter permease [Bacillota bacterium]
MGAAKPVKKSKPLIRKSTLIAWSFILPNFIGFATFTLVPVVWSFVLAFMEWNAFTTPQFVGMDNFSRLLRDDSVHIALRNTVNYTVGTVPLTLVASLGLALLLNNAVRGMGFFRTAIFFPFITSLVAVAFVWMMLFHPTLGPINSFLREIGIENPPRWLASVDWAMPALIITSVWRFMGYYMVIYLAGLQSIPNSLYEAAEIDGASAWRRFVSVTLPMLRPTTFFIVIMLTINSFRVFDLVQIMTNGGPGRATTVLVHQLYIAAFVRLEFGYASAIALVLFFIIITITIVQFLLGKKHALDG